MHIAVRSSVATGVALVGAGAIALSPIQPIGSFASPLSEIDVPAGVSNIAIELAAQPNPIQAWVDVFTGAVTNAGALGTALLADPLPIGRQVARNWIGYGDIVTSALSAVAAAANTYLTEQLPELLKTAGQQIADGEPAAAASTINQALGDAIIGIGLPFFPVVDIPGKITDNLTAAVKSITGIDTLLNLLIAAIGPPTGFNQALGDSAQVIVDSAGAGDYGTAVTALINLPATLTGALINGYTPPGGSIMPGLFTPPDENGYNAGLVYTLMVTIPKSIATAITPVAPEAAAKVAKPASVEATAADATAGDATALPTDATDAPAVSAPTPKGTGGSRVSGKSVAKGNANAKKPTGAKQSSGAKSARPHKGAA